MSSRFETIDHLLETDEESPLPSSEFDDALWLLLVDRISTPADLRHLPEPVGDYFASRLLEWEVGNGGFAQAAFNVPEWFERAAAGYESLGKPESAALIRKAMKLLGPEREEIERRGLMGATIGAVFEFFRESRLGALDDRIPEGEWWIDDERVEFVRSNREAFRGLPVE